MLTAEGHAVLEAGNGLEGLDIAQRERPDLILVDINVPDLDGYEVAARLRALGEAGQVPIVALTVNVLRGDRERSLRAGCDGFIAKPIDPDRFPDQVKAALRGQEVWDVGGAMPVGAFSRVAGSASDVLDPLAKCDE